MAKVRMNGRNIGSAILILLAACSDTQGSDPLSSAPPAGWIRHTSDLGYTVDYPDEWKPARHGEGSEDLLVGLDPSNPTSGRLWFSVLVLAESEVERNWPNCEAYGIPDGDARFKATPTEADGVAGVRYSWDFIKGESGRTVGEAIHLATSGLCYRFTWRSPDRAVWESVRGTARRVARTITFDDRTEPSTS